MKISRRCTVCITLFIAVVITIALRVLFPIPTKSPSTSGTTDVVSPIQPTPTKTCDKDLYQTATLKNLELPWTYHADDAQLDQAQRWVDAKREWVSTLAVGCERAAYEDWLLHVERQIDRDRAQVARRAAADALARTIAKPPR